MPAPKGNKYAEGCETSGRPPKYTSVEEMEPIIKQYLTNPANKPFRVSGLCKALQITRETLSEYESKEEFSDAIKLAKLNIEDDMVERGLKGDSHATFSMFLLKNSFGYKDKSEVENTFKGALPISKDTAKQIIDELEE